MGINLKKGVILFGVFVVIIIAFYIIINRSKSNLFDGKTGYTGSISKSKELNVFVREYKLLQDSISLGDQFFIPGEIWIEKVWKQGNYENSVVLGEPNEYSNFWLYIEIPEGELIKTKRYFDALDTRLAFKTIEGKVFWKRKYGNKNFFVVSFKDLPDEKVEIKVLERREKHDRSVIPEKWTNPSIIDEITLVKK